MINLIDFDTDKKVNSGFGQRVAPTKGASKEHLGIDITLADDNIPSIMSGVVEYVGFSKTGGNMIFIRNNDGTLAKYMHMATKSPLSVGDKVMEGQTIGIQGNTGVSTGKHLHLGIMNSEGEYLDPADYLNTGYTSENNGIVNKITGGVESAAMGIVGNVITFIAVVLILVLAAYLFMQAFEIKIF